MRRFLGEYRPMTGWPLELRRASASNLDVIIGVIEDVAAWLRLQKTDQWDRPWPNQEERDDRIKKDLNREKTWIAWDGDTAAATITTDWAEDLRWPEQLRRYPAVYIQRLVVRRPYAGKSLGAELLDWAGRNGQRDHGAAWIRVSAWTTNQGLHAYYKRQGFRPCGLCDNRDGYPSAAMFQKPTAAIGTTAHGLFTEEPPCT
jgi:GNAT superfamily N-acetyltransferase